MAARTGIERLTARESATQPGGPVYFAGPNLLSGIRRRRLDQRNLRIQPSSPTSARSASDSSGAAGVPRRQVGARGQHQWHAGDASEGNKIALDVESNAAVHDPCQRQRAAAGKSKGVAVGRCLDGQCYADHAVGAGPVLRHHRRFEEAAQDPRYEPRKRVALAPGEQPTIIRIGLDG